MLALSIFASSSPLNAALPTCNRPAKSLATSSWFSVLMPMGSLRSSDGRTRPCRRRLGIVVGGVKKEVCQSAVPQALKVLLCCFACLRLAPGMEVVPDCLR